MNMTETFSFTWKDFKTDCSVLSDEFRKNEPYVNFNDPGSSEAWVFFSTPERFRVKAIHLHLYHRRTGPNTMVNILVNGDKLRTRYDGMSVSTFELNSFDVPLDFCDCEENKVSVVLHKDSLYPYHLSDVKVEVDYSTYNDIFQFL